MGRFTLATWNIQGAEPGLISLFDIVKILQEAPMKDTARNPNKKNIPDGPTDVYVIGLQEIIPMDRTVKIPLPKITFRGGETLDLTRTDLVEKVTFAWTNRLVPACNQIGARYGVQYRNYASRLFNGIGLFIIVRTELEPLIRRGLEDVVRADEAPSDLEILMLPDNEANGAVGVKMDIGASSLAFVNCRLLKGEGFAAVAERNRQFRKIANEMFADRNMSLSQQEYVFWMGDLNYKLATPSLGNNVTPKEVWNFAKRGQLDLLLRADELSAQRASGVAFGEYREGVPNFPPTYPVKSWIKPGQPRPTQRKKFSNGLKMDDSETPGWLGRILWRRNTQGIPRPPEFHGGLVAYARVDNITKISQHLPVVAVIDIELTRAPQRQRQFFPQQQPQIQQPVYAQPVQQQVQPTYAMPAIQPQPQPQPQLAQPAYWPQVQPQIQPQPQPVRNLLALPPPERPDFATWEDPASVFKNFIL